MIPESTLKAVQDHLRASPDLGRPYSVPGSLLGHCYLATEVVYHLGAKAAGYKPQVVRVSPTETHWFLRHPKTGDILDPTAEQFDPEDLPPLYEDARGCGFLTLGPSRRAAIVMKEIEA